MPKPTVKNKPGKPKKQPRVEEDPEDVVKHRPLAWGLKRLDLDSNCEWSWRQLDSAHIEALHRELIAHEGETLFDLERGHRIKEIPVAHMKTSAKSRLKELKLEEQDSLWEIRLPNKWRVWGIMRGNVFSFLWWDESETACHHVPKGQRRR